MQKFTGAASCPCGSQTEASCCMKGGTDHPAHTEPSTNAVAAPWLLRQAQQLSLRRLPALQSMVGQLPKERRRRLSAQPAVQTDPGADGIAIGLDGHIYSDTAITDAVAQVGQLGPLNPKVAVCHFPPQDRSQWQASPLLALQAGSTRRAPSGPSQCGGLSAYWPEDCSTQDSGAHCMLLMWYRADSHNSLAAIPA